MTNEEVAAEVERQVAEYGADGLDVPAAIENVADMLGISFAAAQGQYLAGQQ